VAGGLAVLSLTGSASPAAASVTIGQLSPDPSTSMCSTGDVDFTKPTVTSGSSYVVPGTGTITSWSHNAKSGSGQEFTMKIFRKVADPATYMVVGHDGPRDLAGGTLNGFPASIPVEPGDVLGFNRGSPTTTSCFFDAPSEPSLLFRIGNMADGDVEAFAPSFAGVRLNISAVFEPSNTFTLGKVRRNRRKGTATLTATVPNAGELALSGKGVKRAGADGALAAKIVPAAGKVKLLIRARGKKRRKLNETGKVTVKPKFTYTPTGGDPRTKSRKLTLRKR